jgi:hypothetical protein
MGADPAQKTVCANLPNEEGAISICREVAAPTLSEITKLIISKPDAIEAGLVHLDSDLFIPSVGEIDLVGASKNQLVMVSIFGELTADHLGKAAGIRQWTQENATVLKRVYLSDSQKEFAPRILFLCSEVDGRALLLMKMIANLPLEIYRYRCLESGGQRWLTIEKVSEAKKAAPGRGDLSRPHPHSSNSRQRQAKLPSQLNIELTDEEIGEFFDGAPDLENPEFGDIITHDESTFQGPYFNS